MILNFEMPFLVRMYGYVDWTLIYCAKFCFVTNNLCNNTHR